MLAFYFDVLDVKRLNVGRLDRLYCYKLIMGRKVFNIYAKSKKTVK